MDLQFGRQGQGFLHGRHDLIAAARRDRSFTCRSPPHSNPQHILDAVREDEQDGTARATFGKAARAAVVRQ
ncbi:hypothetical protein [Streptomyces sp. NPDC096068]|uniref:hypothetical protein n=1 Tax=Streptomyces sp. NPDC096068 TaxID=3155424 RepID=UPI0033288C2C